MAWDDILSRYMPKWVKNRYSLTAVLWGLGAIIFNLDAARVFVILLQNIYLFIIGLPKPIEETFAQREIDSMDTALLVYDTVEVTAHRAGVTAGYFVFHFGWKFILTVMVAVFLLGRFIIKHCSVEHGPFH